MAFTNPWLPATPPDTELANLLGQNLRDLKTDIMQRMGGFGAGLAAARPTPDSAAGANFTGVMYWETDTGLVFMWNGAAWIDITANIGGNHLPTAGGSFVFPAAATVALVWQVPAAVTALTIKGYVTGGTATINATKLGAGALHNTNIALVADTPSSTAVNQNSAFAVDDKLLLNLVSIDSGAPSYVFIQVDFSRP